MDKIGVLTDKNGGDALLCEGGDTFGNSSTSTTTVHTIQSDSPLGGLIININDTLKSISDTLSRN